MTNSFIQLELVTEKPKTDTRAAPILFVHGMWHGAWCWEEHFLPYFAELGYEAHALSLRGHGSSNGRDRLRWTSIADYVSDVEQVVNRMSRRPLLVGHSMGGMVVQKFLEIHKAAGGVLLASVPPSGAFLAALSVFRRHPVAFLKTNLTLSLYPIISTPRLARDAFFSKDLPEEKLAAYFSRMQNESYRAFLDLLAFVRPKPELINTPMLVLGAAEDTIFTQKEIESTARAYGAQAEIFPDMAHDMMLEPGWRQVADRIIKFFREEMQTNGS